MFISSQLLEVGISAILVPMRYLAAVSAGRFMLDFAFNDVSDTLSIIDRFHPREYYAFSLYAFASDTEWNLDFFIWQLPAVVLTLFKFVLRRRRIGAACGETWRVGGVLVMHVLLRAFMASFAVDIPQSNVDAANAAIAALCEMSCMSYLIRHTWPFE